MSENVPGGFADKIQIVDKRLAPSLTKNPSASRISPIVGENSTTKMRDRLGTHSTLTRPLPSPSRPSGRDFLSLFAGDRQQYFGPAGRTRAG
jgi:hypothetical protein